MVNVKKDIKKKKMKKVLHEYKQGLLKSSSGKSVIRHKQDIAIGISEALRAKQSKRV